MLEKLLREQLEKNNFTIPMDIIKKLNISWGSITIPLVDFINILIDARLEDKK